MGNHCFCLSAHVISCCFEFTVNEAHTKEGVKRKKQINTIFKEIYLERSKRKVGVVAIRSISGDMLLSLYSILIS